MAALAQPVLPSSLGFMNHALECFIVSYDAEVLNMAAQFLAQLSVLLFQWLVSILPTPFPDRFHRLVETFLCRFSLDYPIATPRFCPVVSEAQEIETPRFFSVYSSSWLPKVDERRFRWMNG